MIWNHHITPLFRREVPRACRKKIPNFQTLFLLLVRATGLPDLGLLRYREWKSLIISGKFSNLVASYHSLSSSQLIHLT